MLSFNSYSPSDFPLKNTHPNSCSPLLKLLAKSLAKLTLQNLLICSLWMTQLKVIKTSVFQKDETNLKSLFLKLGPCFWSTTYGNSNTAVQLWAYFDLWCWAALDHVLGEDQYPTIKNWRKETNGQWNRSEDCCFFLAAVTLMLTTTQLQLHTTFSPLGAMVCGAAGHLSSQT